MFARDFQRVFQRLTGFSGSPLEQVDPSLIAAQINHHIEEAYPLGQSIHLARKCFGSAQNRAAKCRDRQRSAIRSRRLS